MSTVTGHEIKHERHVGDYLLTGVFVMLAINAVQRVVGLLRGIGFCRFLTDEQLGGWALANSFFMIGVPLALLGLPGSFSKFVEYYRRKDQLGNYLLHVLSISAVGVVATLVWILAFPNGFSWLVFQAPANQSVVLGCAFAFISLILFSVVYEIVGSMRHVRVVAIMQFLQSVVFALVGIPLIAKYGVWTVLLPSFSIACLIATLPGLWVILTLHRHELALSRTFERVAMWKRIMPYAASLWLMNMLSNTFESSDRYMLLHLSQGGPEVGLAYVGQYHCGRILPNLLTSVALMLGGVLLPYLSADWESGNRDRIAGRMRQMLQFTTLGSMAISILAMLAAPYLFHYGFGGRYAAAEAILPMVLTQAVWMSLFMIAQAYMLCAEKGKEIAMLLAIGLSINLGLNWFLIMNFGLFGAVIATAISSLLTLLGLFHRMAVHACTLNRATVVLCVAPIVFVLGPTASSLALVAFVVLAGRTDWLLTPSDRQQIDEAILPKLKRIGIQLETIWP